MDSLTQATLGGAIGKVFFDDSKKGVIAGALIATMPDLDVIFYLFYDKFEMLSIHRGLSHSIVFSVFTSVVLAFILKRLRWFRNIGYRKLFSFVWVIYFTHILLDTFTTYGTQLLLPFSDRRFGLDSINVVDPIYTVPLLLGLILSLYFQKIGNKMDFNRWGLIISSCYLVFTFLHKKHLESTFVENLTKENISYSDLLTVPVGIANLNWYGVARSPDSIYLQQYSTFGGAPKPFEVFPINEHLLKEIDATIANKMRWFAKGFYTVENENETIRIYNLQVDMRGITEQNGRKAPTKGYFQITRDNGKQIFSSGSWE